jgi:methylmalonyl-CoA mutase N-terminal domain/subunit
MLSAIESGWVQSEIHESAYKYQQSIETKERIIVGVNDFQMEEERSIPIHRPDPALEAAQIETLRHARARRAPQAVRTALEKLEEAALGSENLMPRILDCVEVYATVGEISDVLRRVHGEYQEAMAI